MPPIPITFVITDLHLGGSPLMLRDLAIGLAARGTATSPEFHVSIISLKPLPPEIEQQKNSDTPAIPQQLRAAGIAVHSLNLKNPLHIAIAVPRLTRLLRRLQPAIVYSILIHANALCTLALPFITSKSGSRPAFIQSIHTLQPDPRWHWTLQGIISKYATALIVPARPILERISRYGEIPRGVVIPNGIDVARFASADPIPEAGRGWTEGCRVVGYVGRFDPVKNLPLLLRAFASIHQPDLHLALVGYGPQESELRTLAKSLHIAPFVHFPGPTSTPERWYKSFNVMCLPSAVEGFGLTLVEAIAAGIPVVCIDTPVTAAIVRNGIDGRRVPPTISPDGLGMILKELMANPRLPPLRPTSPPSEPVTYIQSHYSTARMVELHADFLKNFANSAGL